MRKLIAFTLILGLGAVAAGSALAGSHQVAICHFKGHVNEAGATDFVVVASGQGCLNNGGNLIVVARQACDKGHDARGNCQRDNVEGCTLC